MWFSINDKHKMEFLDKILGKKYKTEYNGNLFTSEFRFGVLANVNFRRVAATAKVSQQ